MACDADPDALTLRILNHSLYELRRGVRPLFMMTMGRADLRPILLRLEREAVASFVQEVTAAKVNLFFGRAAFVETVGRVVTKPLCRLSPEEDFILGTLLGYDREQQCLRFLARRGAAEGEAGCMN